MRKGMMAAGAFLTLAPVVGPVFLAVYAGQTPF